MSFLLWIIPRRDPLKPLSLSSYQKIYGDFTKDKYEVGYFVSTDQIICKTLGLLPTGYGIDSTDSHFQGGTIYNNVASGMIWIENQVLLGINETMVGKSQFEWWLWGQAVAEVSHYNGNNGIFTVDEYRKDCDDKGQSQIFWGVGAQHHNAWA